MQSKDSKKSQKTGKVTPFRPPVIDMDTPNIVSTGDYTGAVPSAPSDEQLESYMEIFGGLDSYPAE